MSNPEHVARMLEHQRSLAVKKDLGLFDTSPNEPEPKGEDMNVNEAFSSKYLRHSDLNGRRIAVTIARVTVETVGQGEDARKKPVLYFQGKDKGLALNKTNALTVSKIIGSPDTDHWTGHKIVLFPDTTLFQGQMVDCVRISAMPKGPQPAAPAPPPPPAHEEAPDAFEASDEDVPF